MPPRASAKGRDSVAEADKSSLDGAASLERIACSLHKIAPALLLLSKDISKQVAASEANICSALDLQSSKLVKILESTQCDAILPGVPVLIGATI